MNFRVRSHKMNKVSMKIINIGVFFLLVWGSALAKDETETSQPIFPQQLTARNLLSHCASSSLTDLGRTRQRYCWGFISGVEESVRLQLQKSPVTVAQKICVPEGVSSRNLAKAYTRYAGRKDYDLERPAAQVVVEVLVNAYPCKP